MAIAVAPTRAGTHLNRALARLALDRDREALDDLDRAIALHPSYAVAYGHRARARYELGNSAAALDDANRALRLDPNVSIALTVRGSVAFDRGETEAARRDLDQAIEIEPGNLVARRIRARLRGRFQEWAGVRADMDVVLATQKVAEMFMIRALAHLGLGDAEGCAADCTESLKLKPGDGEALGLRAMAREQLKDPKGALDDAKAALEAGISGARADSIQRLIERLQR
jgi:tetratricopeptide (TPR) repeat protein